MELKGTRGLFDTVKSSRTWSVASVFLRLAVLTRFGGRFGPKKAVLGHKTAQIWEGTYRLGATAPGRHW